MRGQGIAVVRPLYLGDLLCAVPALRALRAAAPDAPVTLVGLPWALEFAARFRSYVDRFVPFPGWPGIPEREPARSRLCGFYASCSGQPYDLVLQMHGDGRVMNGFVRSIPARVCAGFAPAAEEYPTPLFTPYPTHLPERLRPVALLQHLGIEARGEEMEFPLDEADHREAARALREAAHAQGVEVPRDYVLIHPGSRSPDRRWAPGGFAAVADALAAEGCTVVLTGTDAESEVVDAVRHEMRAPAIDLVGRTSLGGAGALVQGARVLVSNDTGVSHLAAAVGTPSAVIFTGSDPARWAPLDRERHRPLGAGNGAPGPTPTEVIRATRALLGRAA